MRKNAEIIYKYAINNALPDNAVRTALEGIALKGRVHIIAVGKAAWQMAKAAVEVPKCRGADGIVVTKHGYSLGDISGLKVFTAGHPVPDEYSYMAADEIIDFVKPLDENDSILFLLSGGGSALFEKPLIPPADMERLTARLLASGADIVEINTLRKRFSAVKGGRFARLASPAWIYSVILSDVIGDRLDMIASGPAVPDSSTAAQAKEIVRRYGLELTERMKELIECETPKRLDNVETYITGSVRQLCASAAKKCGELGYEPFILTDSLSCTASDAGVFLSNIAQRHAFSGKRKAFIVGGETVVRLTGNGKGGRNQELALAAAEGIAGLDNVCIFSVGSDGTDGPTDAAGGYVDGNTRSVLESKGIKIYEVLKNNDSYHALEDCGGLIKTGATGTNVNDLAVLLID